MGRRRGWVGIIAQAERDQARRQRQQASYALAAERAIRANQRAQAADEKERARLYVQSKMDEAEEQNTELEEQVSALHSILRDGLTKSAYIDLDTLRQPPKLLLFQPGPLANAMPPPLLETYLPPALSWIAKLMPGMKAKHEVQRSECINRHRVDLAKHADDERIRQQKLADYRENHEAQIAAEQLRTQAQHAQIDEFKKALDARSPAAVVDYFNLTLQRSGYPDDFPGVSRLAYVPESKQLVIEVGLPTFDIVPEAASFKYMKSKDEIVESPRPAKERRALYGSIIAQTTLRTLREVFSADRAGAVDSIVLNGHVDAIDKATGQSVRPCVVTVRTSRDVFLAIDLQRVEPSACLRALHASVSKSPEELAPVRPVLEFNMVDPRFIDEVDVLSILDQRPNLMELTPGEFESLITNLFEKMGLETRLTRSSRDGGVDCVAYDPRPIFGGKVVIQAKRYKHTVGVSAVRDLFGTLQNEGASKGILVTTSGFGKASFEFAEGKPIELLSGSHLLHLLAEHAQLEARIVMPEDWTEPSPDFEMPVT